MTCFLGARRAPFALLIASLFMTVQPATAQFGRNRGYVAPPPMIPSVKYDGRFTFARLSFVTSPGGYYYNGMPAWAHGYNLAERNLLQILNSLSTVGPRLETGVVLNLDDPELFNHPVAYMAEPGYWSMTDKECESFRSYLKKGGFVIFDDFRDPGRFGGIGWAGFAANMERVLPKVRFFDLTPQDPIFHTFYEINSLTIIPQNYDAGRPILRAIYEDNDPTRRMLAMINFNTDVSNYWEFSSQGSMPISQSNEAYKLGVNYLIYAMTH